jgi:hypothetical protein
MAKWKKHTPVQILNRSRQLRCNQINYAGLSSLIPSGCEPVKGHGWDTMERLHLKGFISDPRARPNRLS